jgi:hypothetical protein
VDWPKGREVGWVGKPGARSTPSAAGSISSGWASRSRCPVLVTTKPTPPGKSCSSASWKTQIRQIQHAHPHAKAGTDVAMDEHRVGLKPGKRRVWAWHPDIARSFVCNTAMNGSTCMDFFIPSVCEPMGVVADRVNMEVFSLTLAHFAQVVSAGPDRHVVLVQDPRRVA